MSTREQVNVIGTSSVGMPNRHWFQQRLTKWSREHLRDFPWRRTQDPYRIFVAEFLLQQTDAPRVVPVYEALLADYPSLSDLAQASEEDMSIKLQPLGFHFRAPRLVQAAKLIMANHGTAVPSDEAALVALPGVGRYIARSICTNAFGQKLAVLDTNVARILQRFFGLTLTRARARNDPRLWEAAQRIAVKENVARWNLTLIDFGASVCTTRNPKCQVCPLNERCHYALSNKQA